MKGLDLKDWVKVASDNKSTTLQHKKGHTMMIAHGGIPKIQQEQLKRLKMADGGMASMLPMAMKLAPLLMADGGQVQDDVPEPNKKNAQEMQQGATSGSISASDAWKNLKEGIGMAEGGDINSWTKREDNEKGINKVAYSKGDHNGMSEAGRMIRPIVGEPADEGDLRYAKKKHKKILGEMKEMKGQNREYLADGTPDSPVEAEPIDENDSENQSASTPGVQHGNVTIINQAPPAPSTASVPSENTPVQQEAQRQIQAVGQQQTALKQQQAIDTQAGQNQQVIEAAKAQYAAESAKRANDAFSTMQNANAALTNNTKDIKPNQYLESMNAGQKMSTALGLLIGGFSTPFTGRSNPAMDFLNDQITRNIAAQQQHNENQKTIWGAAKDLFGEDNIANHLARASEYDRLNAQGAQMAASLKTAQAAQQYNLLSGQLLNAKNKELYEASKYLQSNPAAYQQARGKLMGASQQQAPTQPGQPAGSPSAIQEQQGQSINPKDHLLNDKAQDIYNGLETGDYGLTHTPKQVADTESQFSNAQQTDKAIDTINEEYPNLIKNRTYGGWVANHANALGALAGAGTEAASLALAPPTGGASLLGGLAGAGAAAAGTAGTMHLLGNMMGGQQQTDYETSANKLLPIIEAALVRNGSTPTDAKETAVSWLPTKFDGDEQAKHKMEALKEKLKSLTVTGALKSAKMLR